MRRTIATLVLYSLFIILMALAAIWSFAMGEDWSNWSIELTVMLRFFGTFCAAASILTLYLFSDKLGTVPRETES